METLFALLIGAAIAIALLEFAKLKKRGETDTLTARFEEFTRGLTVLAEQLNTRLREAATVTQQSQRRTDEALGSVAGQLGEQRATLSHIVDFQKDLRRFQELLQPPKARGGIGEKLLEHVLSDLLPQGSGIGQYEPQYLFHGGERVDFIIRLKDFLVPIDAKFPLNAFTRIHEATNDDERNRAERDFRQAVKQHIDAVAKKYIRPDEGTADFAFLYIPSEAVFAGFTNDPELTEYAFDQRIVVVSPGTFYAYLNTILIGLRGFAVEASARELLGSLSRLEVEFAAFGERFRISGGHLRNALKAFEESERQMGRIGEFLTRWRGIGEQNPEK